MSKLQESRQDAASVIRHDIGPRKCDLQSIGLRREAKPRCLVGFVLSNNCAFCAHLFDRSSFGFRISDFGFRISDFGFRISDFGFAASPLGISIRMNLVPGDRAPDADQESCIGQHEAVRGPRAGDSDAAVQRKPAAGCQGKEHREWHTCGHRDKRRLSRNQQR